MGRVEAVHLVIRFVWKKCPEVKIFIYLGQWLLVWLSGQGPRRIKDWNTGAQQCVGEACGWIYGCGHKL